MTGHNGILSARLVGGTAQISAQPAWLTLGNNTLPVAYSGDSNYNTATTTVDVAVGKANTSLLVTPNPTSITTTQSLSVYVSVFGFGFFPAPTGTLTLTSGTYSSAPASLDTYNSATFTIPAGALAAGTDTLTASYSGDSNFNPVMGTVSVAVTFVPPSFTVGATAVTITAPGATTGNTSTITISPAGGFTGSVVLNATIASSPAGAQHLPQLSFGTTSPATVTGTGAATATLTITTTAPTTGALLPAPRPGGKWYPLGETAVAGILLFGLRVRRRGWRAIVGSVLLLVAFTTAVLACGGGGGGNNSTPPPTTTPGTTAGTYSIAVTGTSGATSAATSLTVIVQ